jgi:arsenical-resistance protein 2
VREVAGDNDMQVLVLEGGVKGWVKSGDRFTGLMDGYRKEYWEEVFREEEEEKKKEGEKGQVVGV